MPTKKPDAAEEAAAEKAQAASDAAVDEAMQTPDADEAADTDEVAVSFAGVDFAVSRKKVESVQFRRLMQRGRDLVAVEWVMGADKMDQVLRVLADKDGVTTDEAFTPVFDAIGKAVGSGNS